MQEYSSATQIPKCNRFVVPVRKTEQSCTVVVVEARRAEAVLLLLCTPDADGKAAVEKSVAAAMATDEWCSSKSNSVLRNFDFAAAAPPECDRNAAAGQGENRGRGETRRFG